MSTGSSSTTKTSTQLSPELQNAYSGVTNQATNLAGSDYTGQLTAPMTDAQKQAESALGTAGSAGNQYYDLASSLLTQAGAPITLQPFSQQAVDQYMSPYIGDVVNSTLASLNQQYGQEQNSLRGNAASAHALGGDRAGVAMAALMGQQELSKNKTISQLYNDAYQSALGQYNTVAGQQLSAQEANKQGALGTAGAYAGLGSSAVQNALAGSTAQFNAGTVEQQTAQNADTAAYQKWLQQFTNLADVASILGSTASATGTTTSQTKKNAPIIKEGGRVPHYADGGFLPAPSVEAFNQRQPITVPMVRGPGGAPDTSTPPSMASSAMGDLKNGLGLYSAGSNLAGLFGGSSGAAAAGAGAEAGAGIASGAADVGASAASGIGDAITSLFAFLKDGGSIPRLAGGGDVDDDDIRVLPVQVAVPQASLADAATDRMASPDEVPHFWNDFATHAAAPSSAPANLGDAVAPVVQSSPPEQETFLQRIGATQGPGTGAGVNYRPGSPGWGLPVLSMIASGLANRSIGAGLGAGLNEYVRESDLDKHPVVDNSGLTTRIFYPSENKWIDTGLPTEASIYKQGMLAQNQAALAERTQNHQDVIAQRIQAERDADENRKTQLKIAGINAQASRQAYIPYTMPDAKGNAINGVLKLPTKGGEQPTFIPIGGNKYDPNSMQGGANTAPWEQYSTSAPTGSPSSAIPKAPPGFKLAPDGGYYAPDPNRPGKYLKWTP